MDAKYFCADVNCQNPFLCEICLETHQKIHSHEKSVIGLEDMISTDVNKNSGDLIVKTQNFEEIQSDPYFSIRKDLIDSIENTATKAIKMIIAKKTQIVKEIEKIGKVEQNKQIKAEENSDLNDSIIDPSSIQSKFGVSVINKTQIEEMRNKALLELEQLRLVDEFSEHIQTIDETYAERITKLFDPKDSKLQGRNGVKSSSKKVSDDFLEKDADPKSCCQVESSDSVTVYFCKGGHKSEELNAMKLWGSQVYTSDSNRCKAALHSGQIGVSGGYFTTVELPGSDSYAGTNAHEVTSSSWGPYSSSFVVMGGKQVDCLKECKTLATTNNEVVFVCKGTANGCNKTASVWGSLLYTDDSCLCRAALHSEAISERGGLCVARYLPGRSSYTGSFNRGVTTSNWNNYHRSFAFVPQTIPANCGLVKELPEMSMYYCRGIKKGCDLKSGAWGIGPYCGDSSYCACIKHDGCLGKEDGFVLINKLPGQNSYGSSSRNGITSLKWDKWHWSFSISKIK